MKDLEHYEEDWACVIAGIFGEKNPPGYEKFWKKYFEKLMNES